jgi:hypothetical protein
MEPMSITFVLVLLTRVLCHDVDIDGPIATIHSKVQYRTTKELSNYTRSVGTYVPQQKRKCGL